MWLFTCASLCFTCGSREVSRLSNYSMCFYSPRDCQALIAAPAHTNKTVSFHSVVSPCPDKCAIRMDENEAADRTLAERAWQSH